MENLHEAYNRDSEKLHKTELAKARIEGDQKNLQNRIWDTYKLTYAGQRSSAARPSTRRKATAAPPSCKGRFARWGRSTLGRWRNTPKPRRVWTT